MSTGKWRWNETGEVMKDVLWAECKPDNRHKLGEDCVTMCEPSDFFFNDAYCEDSHLFTLCEYHPEKGEN